ncbi:hypothetical protein BCAH1134_C0655 (plasmid) [Bacillus cereus AH1134]|nr:hypothetical protein BCAH1134_C0655 [Bacillus cereus AH1134]
MARSYAVDLNHKNELFCFVKERYDNLCVIKIAHMFRERVT